MAFKALAIDLDGTLLVGNELPEAHIDAVKKATDAGFRILLASARWHQVAERYARQLDLRGPIIACNGAQVYLPDPGPDLVDRRLPAAFVTELYELCNASSCTVVAMLGHRVILKADRAPNRELVPEMSWANRLDRELHAEPLLIAISGDITDSLRQRLDHFQDQVDIRESIGPRDDLILTITAMGADKGAALSVTCDHLGLEAAEVIAIGDAENDIPMFQIAGASVAMGQATARVKAAANHVTTSNTDFGVARFIDRFLAGAGL